MSLAVHTSAHSEIGLVRRNNQDSAYVSPSMLIVADGMGGAAAGDLASAVAVDAIARTDRELIARVGARLAELEGEDAAAPASDDTGDLGVVTVHEREALVDVLAATLDAVQADLAALVAQDEALEGMGTTCCGFVLCDTGAVVVNIGDSRAYLWRDGGLARVTHDHSWVQTLVDDGRITEEEALEHPHRSLIMRVLNGNPAHEPDFGWLDLRPGDRLMVCSDGLCGLVTDDAIAARLGEPDRDAALAALVALAHEAGGSDNITVLIGDIAPGQPEGAVQRLGAATTRTIPPLRPTSTAELPAASPAVTDAAFPPAPRRTGRRLAAAALALAVLGGVGFGAYETLQSRYYLAPQASDAGQDTVAVYRGIPDKVLGQPLHTAVVTSSVRVDDLPPLYAQRVRAIMPVASLDEGSKKLTEYAALASRCVSQRSARATQPAPSASVVPGSAAPTGPAASHAPTPSQAMVSAMTTVPAPAATPATPEDC